MAISPDYAKLAKVPLVKQCRMATEMKQEAIDICTSCLDKQPNDFERCSQVTSCPACVAR